MEVYCSYCGEYLGWGYDGYIEHPIYHVCLVGSGPDVLLFDPNHVTIDQKPGIGGVKWKAKKARKMLRYVTTRHAQTLKRVRPTMRGHKVIKPIAAYIRDTPK